jgi:hypothetical protein
LAAYEVKMFVVGFGLGGRKENNPLGKKKRK